jgi:hypothetical protein
MKRVIVVLGSWLIILLLGGTAFAQTQTILTDVWKDKEYVSTVKKIAIFWIDQDRARRIIIEDEFMRQLKARGIDALPVYVVIPPDKMVERDAAMAKIRNLGAGAVLTVRLVSKETVQSQIPDPAKKDSGESSRWSSYYHYVYDAPARDKDEPAYIETILFDAATEQRVWAARSVSKIEVANLEVVTSIIKSLLDRLASDKMIK